MAVNIFSPGPHSQSRSPAPELPVPLQSLSSRPDVRLEPRCVTWPSPAHGARVPKARPGVRESHPHMHTVNTKSMCVSYCVEERFVSNVFHLLWREVQGTIIWFCFMFCFIFICCCVQVTFSSSETLLDQTVYYLLRKHVGVISSIITMWVMKVTAGIWLKQNNL